MKTRFKNRLGALAVAVALTGAFATQAMAERAKSATEAQGYERVVNGNEVECQLQDMCQIENTGILCTVDYNPDSAQLYRLDQFGNCTQELYRPLP